MVEVSVVDKTTKDSEGSRFLLVNLKQKHTCIISKMFFAYHWDCIVTGLSSNLFHFQFNNYVTTATTETTTDNYTDNC